MGVYILHPECFQTLHVLALKTLLRLNVFLHLITNAQLRERKSAHARKCTDARASWNVCRFTHALLPPTSAHRVCVGCSTHATTQKHARTQYTPRTRMLQGFAKFLHQHPDNHYEHAHTRVRDGSTGPNRL